MKSFVALATALLLVLGACTPSRWDKPDTAPEAAHADLAQCGRSAQQEAFQRTTRPPLFPPFGFRGPFDEFVWGPSYQQFAADQRFYLQSRLTDNCMRAKGYQRVQLQPV